MLGLTYVGYPLGMAVLSHLARGKEIPEGCGWNELPTVSFILVTRNAAGRAGARLRNLLESEYPAELLEVVVVLDGSTDDTSREVSDMADRRIVMVEQPKRQGKSSGLAQAVERSSGAVLVFCDVRQDFSPDAVKLLVARLGEPGVVGCSGALEIAASREGVGGGVDAYWRLERKLRMWEGRVDSCMGCTGAIYALKRGAWSAPPRDSLLDDVVVPMTAVVAGGRVVFEDQARAFDPQRLDPETEKRRKRRTLAGNFQMLFRYPAWLLPWRNRTWLQLICHKYLRLAGPLFLAAFLALDVWLWPQGIHAFSLPLQLGVYVLGLAGLLVPKARSPLLRIPAGFLFLNAMVVLGFADFLRLRGRGSW